MAFPYVHIKLRSSLPSVAVLTSVLLGAGCDSDGSEDTGADTHRADTGATGDAGTADGTAGSDGTHGESGGTGPLEGGDTEDAATDGAEGSTGEPGDSATLAQAYAALEGHGGCSNGYCHGSGEGGLSLFGADGAHGQLVAPATTPACGLTERVVPGDPEASILWQRVRPDRDPCFESMPPGSEGLPPEEAAIVRSWIEGGALP